jgi:hypothetical protein
MDTRFEKPEFACEVFLSNLIQNIREHADQRWSKLGESSGYWAHVFGRGPNRRNFEYGEPDWLEASLMFRNRLTAEKMNFNPLRGVSNDRDDSQE